MSSDRVTVTLPDELRRAVQQQAEEQGGSFSSLVGEELGRRAGAGLVSVAPVLGQAWRS
jgi:hypothetical protein